MSVSDVLSEADFHIHVGENIAVYPIYRRSKNARKQRGFSGFPAVKG